MSDSSKPKKPECLAPLLGIWTTTGATRATADAPSEPIEATDRYEWMEGGFFMLHHIESRSPQAFTGLEVIGPLEADGLSPMRYFDSEGRTQADARCEVRDGVVRIVGDSERFAGRILDGGKAIAGTWERSEDGRNWQQWMDVTLRRP